MRRDGFGKGKAWQSDDYKKQIDNDMRSKPISLF